MLFSQRRHNRYVACVCCLRGTNFYVYVIYSRRMHAGEDDAVIYCGGSVDDEWNWANASHGARVNCEFTRTCAGYLSDYYNSTSEYFTSKEETCPTSFNQCTEWRHTIETCDTDLEKGNTTSTYTTDDTTGCEIIQTIALSYFVPRPHCTQHSNKPLLLRVSSSLPSSSFTPSQRLGKDELRNFFRPWRILFRHEQIYHNEFL